MIMLLLSLSFLVSCKDSSNPISKYGDTVIDKYKSTQQFGDRMSLKNLQQAVTTFRVANSRLPGDLDELERFTGETIDKNKFEYDSSTGTLTLKK
ncbi:MAG TPA: hypothetical protein ENH07_07305 [Nitrospirae bacterium]|nr:hypothetical protein [Nitrospirota bacterium]